MTTLKKIAAAVCAAACIASVSAAPDDISKLNPYGLVYQGAVKTNTAGEVNIHPVTYSLHGIKIAANVYTPANYDAKQSYPAVVVAHPNGGTKEQVAGLFAQRLAELGYITIAADAAYQGASGGEPRHTDKPQFRTEDIHGMASYLLSYPGVDASRLGALGICGGGGYTLNAAKSDKRFAAVATISMFNTGLVRHMGYMNSAADTVQERLKAPLTRMPPKCSKAKRRFREQWTLMRFPPKKPQKSRTISTGRGLNTTAARTAIPMPRSPTQPLRSWTS